MEGAFLVRNVWDHRVRPTVHQDLRDFTVHVLEYDVIKKIIFFVADYKQVENKWSAFAKLVKERL